VSEYKEQYNQAYKSWMELKVYRDKQKDLDHLRLVNKTLEEKVLDLQCELKDTELQVSKM